MRGLIGVILALLAMPAVSAECLHLVDSSFEQRETDVTAPAVEWKVTLENRCDMPYDADLTIHFLDEEGSRLYEVRDLVMVARSSETQAGREVYIPDEYASQATQLEVQIEERERPF